MPLGHSPAFEGAPWIQNGSGGPGKIWNLDMKHCAGPEPGEPAGEKSAGNRSGKMLEHVMQTHLVHALRRVTKREDVGMKVGNALRLGRVEGQGEINIYIPLKVSLAAP
jgi:hypothetical protein